MKKVEITKEIKLAGLGLCKVGSVVEKDEQSCKTLIRTGFAKWETATAKEVAEKIARVKTLNGLEKFKTDTRQVVVAAYTKRLKELEVIEADKPKT